jgi:hypothetical protein
MPGGMLYSTVANVRYIHLSLRLPLRLHNRITPPGWAYDSQIQDFIEAIADSSYRRIASSAYKRYCTAAHSYK